MVILHFVIVLGILIFVHELGHFLVAKFFNVKVEKFSLGFGPKLFGKKIGETEYLISAFPLGGYVKMLGEGGFVEGGESHHPETGELKPEETPRELTEEEKLRSFAHKPPHKRMAIVLAGPVFNIVFAWFLMIVLSFTAYPIMTSRVKPLPDKPAARAGMQANDLIKSVNGKEVFEWDDIAPALAASKGDITIVVDRNGVKTELIVKPEAGTVKSIFGEPIQQPTIGVSPTYEFKDVGFPLIKAVEFGTQKTWKVLKLTVMSIVKLFQGIIPLKTIGGPIMIADMANQAAKTGGSNFFLLLALISINLGILNLLPVPVLDGGHLLFYSLEIVMRRPVSQKVREYAQQLGLVLLIGLMVLAFYFDIARYFFQ